MSTATELLRRVDDLELQVGRAIDEIRAFLATEKESAEPVAWMWLALEDGEVITQYGPYLPNLFRNTGTPLYLHPPKPEPARKPMTEEEIDVGFNPYRMRWLADDQYFVAGVRWAEKHHGIGKDDE